MSAGIDTVPQFAIFEELERNDLCKMLRLSKQMYVAAARSTGMSAPLNLPADVPSDRLLLPEEIHPVDGGAGRSGVQSGLSLRILRGPVSSGGPQLRHYSG